MAKLILYLLESSAVLAFFYLLYVLILRRETFFSLNRFFLIGILVFSLLFPLVSFDFNPAKVIAVERPIEEISKFRMSYFEAMALWEFEGYKAAASHDGVAVDSKPFFSTIDWIKLLSIVLFVVYILGVIVCLSRTAWVFRWIRSLIVRYPREEMGGVKVVKVPWPIAPFSFLKYVFVHEAIVNSPEFDQILAHEKIHVRQRHSIDLIIVQLLAVFYWFNPVIWRLIKSLKTNHEYIADKKIINSGYSLVEYQALLLKQLISNNSFGLVHNFNLSFIKKRITMMKNKKSGWPGKVKVALTIVCTVLFSALIVHCNSRLDDSVAVDAEKMAMNDFTGGVNLPILPATRDRFDSDRTNALNFTIEGNTLTVNDERLDVNEIVPMIEKSGLPEHGIIVMLIDKDQAMGFVREVQMELRKAERRKILYVGQSSMGEKVESRLLLPPTPENAARLNLPIQPDIDDLVAEGNLDLLKIKLGENAGAVNQQKVYDFVKGHIHKQSADYVVSVGYDDDDSYNDYLVNLVYTKEGFYQIYRERAQSMFGKDFHDTDKDEYDAVRKGIPMAISIADKGL